MQKPAPEQNPQGFVLPDLCVDQTLLLLLMAAQLIVIAFMVFEFGFHINWVYFGQVTLYVQWQVVLSVLLLCRLRPVLSRMPKYRAATLAYAVLLLIALLIAVSVAVVIGKPDVHFIGRNMVLSLILGGLVLRYLYIQQQAIEREKSVLQASLSALQARIKPHFLFNTMNSIASLISIAPDKAEKMVEDLSELLRASLRDNVTETSLAEEWQLCERYLAIEQLRLGDRVCWQSDFSGLNRQTAIPALSLQPLVENAIYHGIQPSAEPGFIQVKGWREGNMVHIQVINSKPEQTARRSGHSGNRMAVDNIRLRIAKLYGESARLELRDDGSRFVAYLYYNDNNKNTA